MKLRKIKLFAAGLVIALFALAQYGCEADWMKEYDSSKMNSASTATVSVSNVLDSSAVVGYSVSEVGRVFVVVVPGTDATAAPDPNTMLKLTTPGAVFKKQYVFTDPASLGSTVKVKDLTHGISYKVFALPVNADGVLGEIVTTAAFVTGDSYAPTLDLTEGISPAISGTPAQATNFKPVLTFNEPVVLASAFVVQMGYLNMFTGNVEFVDVPKDSIKIAANKVTISQPRKALSGQYVFLSIGDGSFQDRSGKNFEGVLSGLDSDDAPEGIYWRTKLTPIVPEIVQIDSITDDVTTKIVLDYPEVMDFPAYYNQTKIVVRYTSYGIMSEVQVPEANIAFAEDTLVIITLPRTPGLSQVTFKMAEGALVNYYGNPSAAIDFGKENWVFFGKNLLIGSYGVELTDNTGKLLGSVNASISGAGSDLAINGLVQNIFELPFNVPLDAYFENDTLRVPDWQPLFNATINSKPGVIYFANRVGLDPVAGTLNANGTLELDSWGFYFLSNDGELEGWYKRFNTSVWGKETAVKTYVSEPASEYKITIGEKKNRK